MDYPSPQSGRANPRTDNQRRRRWDPRPSKWEPAAPDKEPSRQEGRSEPNAADPTPSIGARDRILDASHRSNRWALDASLDDYHPIPALAQHRALDPPHWASRSIPADWNVQVSRRLEARRAAPILERAFRSPEGIRTEPITVQQRFLVPQRTNSSRRDDHAQAYGVRFSSHRPRLRSSSQAPETPHRPSQPLLPGVTPQRRRSPVSHRRSR
jgi:hypothetical protein